MRQRGTPCCAACELFPTDDRDPIVAECLAPGVDRPDLLDGVRLHGREEVRAYGARQFATGHPPVRLERLRRDGDGEAVVATVRLDRRDAEGDRWAGTVEHIHRFGVDGRVTRMDVRPAADRPAPSTPGSGTAHHPGHLLATHHQVDQRPWAVQLVPRQATFARRGAASGACSRRAGRTPSYWMYSGFRPVRRVGVPP
ncbi:nuclear transport factor 2 family protein, partial [Streptomyces sp. NPDC003697]